MVQPCRGTTAPIVAHDGPHHHVTEATRLRCRRQLRAAESKWWPDERRSHPRGRFYRLLAAVQLVTRPLSRPPHQVRLGVGVVAEDVPPDRDLADDGRARPGPPPDNAEGR